MSERITLDRRPWCDTHDSPWYDPDPDGDCDRHCAHAEVTHQAGGYEDCMFGVRLVEVPE